MSKFKFRTPKTVGVMDATARGLVRYNMMDGLLQKIRTGNDVLDTLISLALIDSGIMTRIVGCFANRAPEMARWAWSWVWALVMRRRLFGTTSKHCRLQSITPQYEICSVFPKLLWYLKRNTDTSKENMLVVSGNTKQPDTTVSLPEEHTAEIEWNRTKIVYTLRHETMTIHSDREYKRRVQIIDLVVHNVPKSSTVFSDFISEVIREYDRFQEKQVWTQNIYRNTPDGKWNSIPCKSTRRLETIVLKNQQLEMLCNDFESFLTEEQWYRDHDVPYKRGYLFMGIPGTGKTSTIKALACHAKRHIHYLILSTIESDDQLFRLLESIKFTETIVVIEDVDCMNVTHNRLDVPEPDPAADDEKPNRLTLAGLLNAIDGGLLDTHGQILIMTTNHASVLDPALIRSGRIDMRIKFEECDAEQIEKLYENFYGVPIPERIRDEALKDVCPADVTGIFTQHRKDPILGHAKLKELIETAPDQRPDRPRPIKFVGKPERSGAATLFNNRGGVGGQDLRDPLSVFTET